MLSKIIENASDSLKVGQMINESKSKSCFVTATRIYNTVVEKNNSPDNINIVYCLDGVLTVNCNVAESVTLSKNEVMIIAGNAEAEVLHFSRSFKGVVVITKYEYCVEKNDIFKEKSDTESLKNILKNHKGCIHIKNILWADSLFENMAKMDERDKCAYAEFKTMELLYLISRKDIISVEGKKYSNQNTSMSFIVEKMKEYMETHLDEKLTIENMCNKFNISPTLFKTIFKSKYGEPVHSWLQKQRMYMAAKYLCTSSMTVLDIAYEVGFGGTSQFNSLFKKYYGMTPTQYRKLSYSGRTHLI